MTSWKDNVVTTDFTRKEEDVLDAVASPNMDLPGETRIRHRVAQPVGDKPVVHSRWNHSGRQWLARHALHGHHVARSYAHTPGDILAVERGAVGKSGMRPSVRMRRRRRVWSSH